MFPQLARFSDLGFLLLRLMVGIVFTSSGWSHLKEPETRSKEHRREQGLHHFSGRRQSGGEPGRDVRRPDRGTPAACGLILIMLGAIQKKIFVWHTGFWGEKGYGWHYDLMFVVMNLVIIFTGGGHWVLLR